MRTRREVLRTLAALSVGSVAPSALALKRTAATASPTSMVQANKPAKVSLGAQTNAWAIDPNTIESFFAVLDQIKRVGYAGFETGFLNLRSQFASPAAAADRIARSDLTFFGVHVFVPFDKTDPATLLPSASIYQQAAQGGQALGAQRLILSGAPAVTQQDVDRKIEALQGAGTCARNLGLGFAYHNHWGEFQSKVGEIDALYSRTDPGLVSFLLDAGHAYRGGANVPEFLEKHSRRIVGIHFRDVKSGRQVPLGEGTFPLAEVAATLRTLQWSGWAINEEEREDGSKGGLSYIEPAFKALKGAFAG